MQIGLGYFTSLHLARHGATVVMACRSAPKCKAAADEIKSNTTAGEVITMSLDVSSIKSVNKFSTEFTRRFQRLDHTILNAGIAGSVNGLQLNEDGLETVFATNHLGHFQLYNDLSALIESTATKYGVATIVHVSSALHYTASAKYGGTGVYNSLTELNNADTYDGSAMYATTKLYNVLFSNEITDRMKAKKINVLSNAAHPGLVNTNILHESAASRKSWHVVAYKVYEAVMDKIKEAMWTSEDGSLTQLYAAVSKDIITNKVSGKYFHPIGIEMTAAPLATKENQVKLWKFSEELVKTVQQRKNY